VTVEPASSKDDTYETPAILAEDVILFPEMEANISPQNPKSVAAATQAIREHSLIVLIPSSGTEGIVGSIGTLVLLRRTVPEQGMGSQPLWKGLWRVRVDRVLSEDPYVRVRFSRAGAVEEVHPGKSEMMTAVFGQIDEFFKVIQGIPPEIVAFLKDVASPGKLADLCAYSPFFSRGERLDLLRTLDPDERLEKVHKLFERQLNDLKRLPQTTSIMECATCIELADRAFELGPGGGAEVAQEFLNHVSREHPDELLALIAERYGPAFLRRRALK
jgi:ATP-dependent Lon protease